MHQVRNAAFVTRDCIDCEIDHPELGWIPFTATRGDPVVGGRDLFQLLVEQLPAGDRPTEEQDAVIQAARQQSAQLAALAPLPFADYLVGLTDAGAISEAEAEDWLTSALLPAAVEAALADAEGVVSFAVRARAAKPTQVAVGQPLHGAFTQMVDQLSWLDFCNTYRTE